MTAKSQRNRREHTSQVTRIGNGGAASSPAPCSRTRGMASPRHVMQGRPRAGRQGVPMSGLPAASSFQGAKRAPVAFVHLRKLITPRVPGNRAAPNGACWHTVDRRGYPGSLPGRTGRGGSAMQPFEPKDFHVYIIASGPWGVICVGMSNALPNRAWEHRWHVVKGFTTKYWSTMSTTTARARPSTANT